MSAEVAEARPRHVLTAEERARGTARSSRLRNLSPEQRREIARRASQARWAPSSKASGIDNRGSASIAAAIAPSASQTAQIRRRRTSSGIYDAPPQSLDLGLLRAPFSGKLIKGQKARHNCPSGCVPAQEAKYWGRLPWTAMIHLSCDPPTRLEDLLKDFDPGWERMGNPRRPRTQPFWLAVLSSHDDPFKVHPFRGRLHMHILIGNISIPDLWTSLQSWRGDLSLSKHRITGRVEVWDPWGAIHYALAQTQNRIFHKRDEESYCNALLVPPLRSDSLSYWERVLAEDAQVRQRLRDARRETRKRRRKGA